MALFLCGKRYDEDMATPAQTPVTGPEKDANVKDSPRIVRTMRVSDILALVPDAEPVIAQYGLSCFSCSANAYETLEEGCRTHGMAETDIDDVVKDLNELLSQRPSRPSTLTVTEAAAQGLKEIMEKEEKVGWGLVVALDEGGNFCMEFHEKPDALHHFFFHPSVPDVHVYASTLTLASIGGATIDMRDGRFKLDVQSAKPVCACGGNCACGGECECGKK